MFPVNFQKFLRTPFSKNVSGRLLLKLTEIRLFLDISPKFSAFPKIDFRIFLDFVLFVRSNINGKNIISEH